jgi:hypothetical protein
MEKAKLYCLSDVHLLDEEGMREQAAFWDAIRNGELTIGIINIDHIPRGCSIPEPLLAVPSDGEWLSLKEIRADSTGTITT